MQTEQMGLRAYFKSAQLVRMANGDYCLVRPLGLVRGGKGMRHHENLLRLTPRGLASGLWRALRAAGGLARFQRPAAIENEPETAPDRTHG